MADAVSIIAPKPRRLSQEPEGVVSCRRKDKEENYDEKKKKEMELVVEEEVDNLRQLVGDNTFLWACGGRHGELLWTVLGRRVVGGLSPVPYARRSHARWHEQLPKPRLQRSAAPGGRQGLGHLYEPEGQRRGGLFRPSGERGARGLFHAGVRKTTHQSIRGVLCCRHLYGHWTQRRDERRPLLFGLHAEHLNKPHPSQYVEKCKRLVGFAFLCRFMLAFATVIVVFKFSNVEYFDIVVDVVAIRFIVDLSQCKYMVFVAHPESSHLNTCINSLFLFCATD